MSIMGQNENGTATENKTELSLTHSQKLEDFVYRKPNKGFLTFVLWYVLASKCGLVYAA